MNLDNIVVVIPAYKPIMTMVSFIDELIKEGFFKIICIDDGSGVEYEDVFAAVEKRKEVTLLRHAINMGKGRALKTAFNYILSTCGEDVRVVTVDADGQHTMKAVKAVCDAINEKIELILGSRQLSNDKNEKVPLRSRFGNAVTALVFRYLCNISIKDTQTGLRVYSGGCLKGVLGVSGERYEYETNVLLWCKEQEIVIREVPIERIYENDNATSHFHPLLDSIKIYSIILKYMFASFLSVVLDNAIFFLVAPYTGNVFLQTYLGRIFAAVTNFLVNKRLVFKKDGNVLVQLLKYVLLLFVSGTISACGVALITEKIGLNLVITRLLVELILFFFNFYVQKNLIFVKKRGQDEK